MQLITDLLNIVRLTAIIYIFHGCSVIVVYQVMKLATS